MSKIAIHVVDEEKKVFEILDKKGPRPKLFDSQTNYLKDPGFPQFTHTEPPILLEEFDTCCGDECSEENKYLYIVVYAVLQGQEPGETEETEGWVDLPEKAMAEGIGTFVRDDKDSEIITGWYVKYSVCKVE